MKLKAMRPPSSLEVTVATNARRDILLPKRAALVQRQEFLTCTQGMVVQILQAAPNPQRPTMPSNTSEASVRPVLRQVDTQSPERLKIIEISALLSAAVSRTDANLIRWKGSNAQFESTRFVLMGQRTALAAVIAALAGDPTRLKEL